MNLSDKSTATVRTGWNLGILTVVVSLIYKLTGKHLSVDDLLPFSPLVAVAGAAFYRFSRLVSDKFPAIAYVLFGTPKTPTNYVNPPSTPPVENK